MHSTCHHHSPTRCLCHPQQYYTLDATISVCLMAFWLYRTPHRVWRTQWQYNLITKTIKFRKQKYNQWKQTKHDGQPDRQTYPQWAANFARCYIKTIFHWNRISKVYRGSLCIARRNNSMTAEIKIKGKCEATWKF